MTDEAMDDRVRSEGGLFDRVADEWIRLLRPFLVVNFRLELDFVAG